MKICISTTSFGEYDKSYLKLCESKGYELILNPYGRKVKPEELIGLAKEAVGLIAGTESITEEVLTKLTNLKVISRCGVGMETVDLDAAKRLGIKVFNTPDAPTLAVAELTVGLILSLLRKISLTGMAVKNGKWQKLMGNLLSGKRVGIIGFGRIGKKVAELLNCFDCEILFTDPLVIESKGSFKSVPIEKLLKDSDIVSIHVSANDKILGLKELKMMKRGAWLINTSRGEVVDEGALYEVLKGGHLSGAALDVFAQEPYAGALLKLDNVILTPHVGSYAKESRVEMERQSVENLLKGLEAK